MHTFQTENSEWVIIFFVVLSEYIANGFTYYGMMMIWCGCGLVWCGSSVPALQIIMVIIDHFCKPLTKYSHVPTVDDRQINRCYCFYFAHCFFFSLLSTGPAHHPEYLSTYMHNFFVIFMRIHKTQITHLLSNPFSLV